MHPRRHGKLWVLLQAKVYGIITELTLQNISFQLTKRFKHGQLMKEEENLNGTRYSGKWFTMLKSSKLRGF